MKINKQLGGLVLLIMFLQQNVLTAQNATHDPESAVAAWSEVTTAQKIIDINFSDADMPDTWTGETGRDCPSYSNGGYVNTIIEVPVVGQTAGLTYPVLFHNCIFANKESYNGFAGATAAFCRQYYLGESATGGTQYPNNWTVEGHKTYLEDNITYGNNGKPNYGEAGFVQMCRDAAVNGQSMHGWMEIDHIPYVERVQWSWSSTAWGRGIKCDYKVGDGEWQPLVWMGSNQHKAGYSSYSDQGYFMENVINASDVSLRWRVWDGDDSTTKVQVKEDGTSAFNAKIDPKAQQQAPRVHKIKIYGNPVSEAEATFARENPLADVGEITEFEKPGEEVVLAPDADATCQILTVAQDGSGDYTTIKAAINAVSAGNRGIIFIKNGIYEENLYVGTKSNKDKFISLIGESRDGVILTSNVNRGDGTNSYLDCTAMNVYLDRFYAENLTIRNTSGNVGQAEALFTAGDAHLFKNCLISGFQDTYKSNANARGYFYNCVIEGATDFIYDGGLEWFEQCEIRCLKGGQYITAAAESWAPMTKVMFPELESCDSFYPGLFFNACNIVAGEGVGASSYYLGRPWKETCGTAFMNCTYGNHIKAAGWATWGGTENTACYYEYKNKDANGTLVNTSSRVSFGKQATDKEYAAYFNYPVLFAHASKVPFAPKEILACTAPTNIERVEESFVWDASEEAIAWVVYEQNTLKAIVTKPMIEIQSGSNYTVRAVNRYGVTSEPVALEGKERLKAFITAEGFGKYATGGRGGEVVTVTSLADDNSEGTLRWAFNQHNGKPITIVFAVSGEIKLTSQLNVNRRDWTLAGQTAPGDGIVITHNKVNFGGSQNFIVRNVRFRIGQNDTSGNLIAQNACGAENCSNFIFDHCTFGWSVEENINSFDSHFHTIQYCIVHEGLYNAGHSKGARGYGCQWGGSPATYHHNLLAHNKSRSCRFNGARGEDYVVFLEYINNVNYNWGNWNACYGAENTANINEFNGFNSAHECNFIGNYYKPGPASASNSVFFSSSYARDGATSWGPSKWYLEGNVLEGKTSANNDNWSAVNAETYSLTQIKSTEKFNPTMPYYRYSLSGNVGQYDYPLYAYTAYESANDAYNTVLSKVGTINRDRVEQRIIDEVRDGQANYGGSYGTKKGIIDNETNAEGFYAYATDYNVPTDTDKDGMPDEWEKANGLDANVADNNRVNIDGYTALEVYLGSLMGEKLASFKPESFEELRLSQSQLKWNPETGTILLNSESIGSTLTIYNTDGRLASNMKVRNTEVSLNPLDSGIYFVQLHGSNTTPCVTKIMKK